MRAEREKLSELFQITDKTEHERPASRDDAFGKLIHTHVQNDASDLRKITLLTKYRFLYSWGSKTG